MRILVSGFEPFAGEPINPTALLIEGIAKAGTDANVAGFSIAPGVKIQTVLLPTTFAGAFPQLKKVIQSFDPHVILSLGLAGGRGTVDFERVAINCMDSEFADNDGVQPRDIVIESDGPQARFATLPVRALQQAVEKQGIPSRVSNTAGTFVCNRLLYDLLGATASSTRKAGFIHFPFLPEQAARQTTSVPSLTLETMFRALSITLETLKLTTKP